MTKKIVEDSYQSLCIAGVAIRLRSALSKLKSSA